MLCHIGRHTLSYLNLLRAHGFIRPEKVSSVLNVACGNAYESVALEDFFSCAHISACDLHLPYGCIPKAQQQHLSRTEFFTTNMDSADTLPKTEKPFDFVLIQHPNVGFCSVDLWLQNIYSSLGENATIVVVLMFSEEHDAFMRKYLRSHLGEFYTIVFEGKNPTPAELGMNHLIVLKPLRERKSQKYLSESIARSVQTIASDEQRKSDILQDLYGHIPG